MELAEAEGGLRPPLGLRLQEQQDTQKASLRLDPCRQDMLFVLGDQVLLDLEL